MNNSTTPLDVEDDLNAMEGAIARNLFRTDDDSSDDDDDDVGGDCKNDIALKSLSQRQDNNTPLGRESSSNNTFVQYPIMDICLEEQTIGGSIAQRLWPAAAYLANFVMMQHPSASLLSPGIAPSSSQTATIITTTPPAPTTIIELGAGVGLTGLQLATYFNCRVLLTDLPDAMPLLQRNIDLNRKRFRGGENAVQAQVLTWGNQDDATAALQWIGRHCNTSAEPFLIIASDCVYFPKLHEPLEQTLCHLLKGGQAGSKCWIAGMRRWKSDNVFYKNVGSKTKTAAHQLVCECLKETVTRTEQSQREIMRVFSIEWKARKNKKSVPHV